MIGAGTKVAVVGGGAWGTALAIHIARRGRAVTLWIREEPLVERMRERRDNPTYLPGVPVPDSVRPTGSLAEAVDGAEAVFAAVPSPFAREVYRSLEPALRPDASVVVATKGIEEATLALPLDVVAQELGADRPSAVLSGPSFAAEVARGLPTAVVAASRSDALASRIQAVLGDETLRIYTNRDPVGVQVAGATKNVIAIAAGVVDGLGMGANALAAVVTRGLAEIARLGAALGGSPATFSGLAGLGDLVLTCTGDLSRNRRVGQALGRGRRLEDILSLGASIAEGVRTTRSLEALARREGVEMPIVEEVYAILYGDRPPREAVTRLMTRPPRSEESPS